MPSRPAGSFPFVELILAAAGVAAIFLPLVSYSVSGSYLGNISGSVSIMDYIQHSDWTKYGELDLVIFGAGAAMLVALLRLMNPHGVRAAALAPGFAALAAGMFWMLTEFNSANSFLGSTNSYGYSSGVSQGIGLWLGLGVGVVGVIASLMDQGGR